MSTPDPKIDRPLGFNTRALHAGYPPDPTTKAAEYADWQKKLDAAHGKAEIIVGKSRNGPIGTAHLAFDDKTMTFTTLADGGQL